MKIIVTGSLGHIGRPLAKELVEKGHTVTVISSKPEKQKDIEAIGATAAIGSLEDSDFLAAAFEGSDALFAMVPPNYAAPDLRKYYQNIGNSYAKAIQQSGIKHIVHLSSYGADLAAGTGVILGAHDVENILNQLAGVSITHLRPAYFYYNLNAFTDMIKEAGIIGSNYGGDDKLVMVAPEDIAIVAAEEFTTPATGIKMRYIASDDRTASEVAKVLGTAIGKPDLQWIPFTDEQVLASLEKRGMPTPFAAKLVELGVAIHSGILRKDYDLHQPEIMGKTKLEDFAKEFAKAF